MQAWPIEEKGVKIHLAGALLGKALEPFVGAGCGALEIFVNVE